MQYVQHCKWLAAQMAAFVGAVEKVERDEQVRRVSNGLVRAEMLCSARQFDAARQVCADAHVCMMTYAGVCAGVCVDC